jgi:phosphocarrier protein HPr
LQKTVIITNKAGIHVRPAAKIADLANKFNSKIVFTKDGVDVNAKSIMDLLTLAATEGTSITIRAEGDDELTAVTEIEKLIQSKFSEE